MTRPAAALVVALLAAAAIAQPYPLRSERALRTDPKAKAAPAEFAGVWLAEQPAPNGDVTRHHEMRFLDADTAVWSFTQVSPGIKVTSTLRGRYEIAGGELHFHVAERYAGEELMKARDEDKKGPRVYRFAWDGADKAGVSLTAPDAAADSPWRVTTFRRGTPAAAPADPLVPKALLAVDRTIKKEPRYSGTPLYVLYAVGPESAGRMWAVLDGHTLYLDKNGNGDLTEDGEQVVPFVIPGEAPNPRTAFFHVPALEAAGGKHSDFIFSVIRTTTGAAYLKTGLKVDGKVMQHAGPMDLRLTESPAEARVLPFGSRVVTAQLSYTMPATPEVGKAVDFRVRVGTPGVGAGSFVAFGSEDVEANPVAEFEFAAARPGDAPRRVTLPLTERCCGDQFYAALRVPDGSRTGLDAAGLTLSYPNCPWGPVAPVTRRVDVVPRQP